MKPKSLQWKYIGDKERLWIGELKGNSHVRFVLEELEEDKFLIKPNLDGIRKLIVRGLAYAKMMAQEQLNGYAKSLFEKR